MLREHGFEPVGPCVTVAKALQVLNENPVSGAILDVLLVRETSFPIARLLMQRGIPFLFLTGSPMELLPEDLRGATVVRKPLEPSKTIEILVRLIDQASKSGRER
jgi:hypothetical protein